MPPTASIAVGTGGSTGGSSPHAKTPRAISGHRAYLLILLIMMTMVVLRGPGRRVLRHTIPSHPVHGHADAQPRAHTQRPQRGSPIEGFGVEQPSPNFGYPAVGQLHKRRCLDQIGELDPKSVSCGVNGPASGAEDRVLHVRPRRAERINDPLLLRPLGSLEPIQETMTAGGPCTFRQQAMEEKEPIRLRSPSPFDQAVDRRAPDQ